MISLERTIRAMVKRSLEDDIIVHTEHPMREVSESEVDLEVQRFLEFIYEGYRKMR